MYVELICQTHGKYLKRKDRENDGCPKCTWQKRTKTTQTFIEEAKKLFPNYDYSQVDYQGARRNVTIICPEHGLFQKLPTNFLSKQQGCPKCTSISKGEEDVDRWLKEKRLAFIPQHRFKDCRGRVKPLPFDFYLPELNTCIEYNGKQHYQKESRFYSEELITNDKTKAQYCLDNNIRLLVIPYWEDVYELLNSLNLVKADSLVL